MNNGILRGRRVLVALLLVVTLVAADLILLTACNNEEGADDYTKLYYDGKFMCGVCHPPYGSEKENAAVDLVTEANIGWTRFDISWMPYEKDENGNVITDENGRVVYNPSYKEFRERCKFYASKGLRVMAVTPYPRVYFPEEYENNIDITEIPAEKKALMQEHARFFAMDLQGIVQCFQMSNELAIEHFRRPFATLALSAEYIGIFAEAMHPIAQKTNTQIGYNMDFAGMIVFPKMMEKYNDSIDWVGVDVYVGCFEAIMHGPEFFDGAIDSVYERTGKPIVLCEFGYINSGDPKSASEKTAILQQYGYNSEAEAKADIEGFIDAFEERNGYSTMVKEARAVLYDDEGNIENEEGAFNYLFNTDKSSHIYCEIPADYYMTDYPHTKQGHADFFNYMIPHLYEKEYLAGMFIYCFAESSSCYICHQSDCPVETAWGIVTADYEKNLSFDAVKTQYGIIKEAEENK